MSWQLFTVLFLSLTFGSSLSEASHAKKLPSVVLVGTVYCDACSQQDFSKADHFISGAKVAVECGNFHEEVKTNEKGEFKVTLPFSVSKHLDKIKGCSVKLISSGKSYCAVASTTSSSIHLRSREEGTHIFSAGFFTFKPLKQPDICRQELKSEKSLIPNPNSVQTVIPQPIQDPANPTLPHLPGLPPIDPTLPPLPNVPGLSPKFPTLPPLPSVPGLPPKLPTLPPLPNIPGLPTLPPLPNIPGLPTLPPLPKVPGLPPKIPTLPPLPSMPGLPSKFPTLPPLPNIPTLPPLPKVPGIPPKIPTLPPLPSVPGLPPLPQLPPLPPITGIPSPPSITASVNQKVSTNQLPPNSFQPPSLLPPKPFLPPSMLPPNPFLPPSSIVPIFPSPHLLNNRKDLRRSLPNPFQPFSLLPPNPFQTPPLSFQLIPRFPGTPLVTSSSFSPPQ